MSALGEPVCVYQAALVSVDQELAGVSIKQGEFVLPLIICSNYDDRLFEQPDHFNLERSNANRHLSFGRGIHNCLGRLIARAQAQAVFEALLARPEPFYQVETPVWAKRPGSRNMKHLIIREGTIIVWASVWSCRGNNSNDSK